MTKVLEYKFVEISQVTDDRLTEVVNELTAAGWELDDIRFIMTEHSKRPAMAFVSFVRERSDDGDETLN